ncbi:Asp/Glu/hydantoin racemase [Calycina marina]|uniref:Asp/Glu/hydantoin racemase n=1 Tax=Calycina marina TaxID=1763456 RepID=A0A9P7Z1U6_9HELO|nr:Asp/Glu/hydantoin racemase [Calycina marina]
MQHNFTMSVSKQKLLLINPNSTQHMTDGLRNEVQSWPEQQARGWDVTYYTAPSGSPASINSNEDAAASAEVVMNDLKATGSLEGYDAYLVACYSVHPLVAKLQQQILGPRVQVLGIFEASLRMSMSKLMAWDRNMVSFPHFSIISTGKYWGKALSDGVIDYLTANKHDLRAFGNVETTGLSATELHDTDQATVKLKVKEATKRMFSRQCTVVILGCAGMSGMKLWVKEAITEALGEEDAEKIEIIEGVAAGFACLSAAGGSRDVDSLFS